jgi:hypothetical protein
MGWLSANGLWIVLIGAMVLMHLHHGRMHGGHQGHGGQAHGKSESHDDAAATPARAGTKRGYGHSGG